MFREIKLFKGASSILEAYEYNPSITEAAIVTELVGFDEFDNVQIDSVPKLAGAGNYITGQKIGDREISLSFNISGNNVSDVLQTLKNSMLTFDDILLERVFYSSLNPKTEARKETILVKITKATFNKNLNNATIGLILYAADPLKTVYLNGSTTPETGGVL